MRNVGLMGKSGIRGPHGSGSGGSSRRPITQACLLRYCHYMRRTESSIDETSLRRRLKRETTAVHQHLETQLGLLDPSLGIHGYRCVLETFYGFYVPVEIDVSRLAAANAPLGFSLRARAELIERDLVALGRSPPETLQAPGDRAR